jgi:hypothetical protein
VKVEHVKEKSTSDIQVEIVDEIQSKVPKISKLLLDPKIHSSKCCIEEL